MPKSKGRFGRGKAGKVPYGKTLMTRLRNGGTREIIRTQELMSQITPKLVELAIARYNIHALYKSIDDHLSRLIGSATGSVRDSYIEKRDIVRTACVRLEEIDVTIKTCSDKLRNVQSRTTKLDNDLFMIELMDSMRTVTDLIQDIQQQAINIEKESPEIIQDLKIPDPKTSTEIMARYDEEIDFSEAASDLEENDTDKTSDVLS